MLVHFNQKEVCGGKIRQRTDHGKEPHYSLFVGHPHSGSPGVRRRSYERLQRSK